MRVGFIGAGNMAEAILVSLLESGLQEPDEIWAGELRESRRRRLKRAYGVGVTARNAAVVERSDVVFLSVKPQDMAAALEPLGRLFTAKHLVLSIAAGKRLAFFESLLPRARVVRVMPNLAASVGEAMSAFCAGARVRDADRRRTARLLGAFGKVVELDESLFDVVTALSGSGPAFFAYLLEALVAAAVKEGLTRRDALLLGEQTMLGTARVLMEKGIEPAALIRSVRSPKGTTAEGLAVLDEAGVGRVMARALVAAARRSRELSA